MAALGAVMSASRASASASTCASPTSSFQNFQKERNHRVPSPLLAPTAAGTGGGSGSEVQGEEEGSGGSLKWGSNPVSAREFSGCTESAREEVWQDDESVGTGWEGDDVGEGGAGAGAEAEESLGVLEGLEQVVLLSPATMMWPMWYQSLLPSDWWTHPPPWSAKVSSSSYDIQSPPHMTCILLLLPLPRWKRGWSMGPLTLN